MINFFPPVQNLRLLVHSYEIVLFLLFHCYHYGDVICALTVWIVRLKIC